ncbi:MAG: hypothetical protein KDJ29_07670 [Hyphomicrobiales bacterium]|nr:hypothetical protein [Hyphomicrobiales bacterium]
MSRTIAGGFTPDETASVTAIDLWKTAAILLMFVDHYGNFFAPDETIWRAIGRACLPIWFFLIGFARSRTVPYSWLVAGAALTAIDYLTSPGLPETYLNILINFAIIRICLAPIERYVLPDVLRLTVLCVFLALLEPAVGHYLEYGSHGMLLALAGLLHRHWLDARNKEEGKVSSDAQHWLYMRAGVGFYGVFAFIIVENGIYDFPLWELAVLIFGCVSAMLGLILFQPGQVNVRFPVLAKLLRFTGVHTLHIYAIHIAALMIYAGLTQK